MLNYVVVTGRVMRIKESESTGQLRIYVDLDVERDALNADGTRGVDSVQLVLYEARAARFSACQGDVVTAVGALRTGWSAPSAEGYRTPITSIDVRKVYGDEGRG